MKLSAVAAMACCLFVASPSNTCAANEIDARASYPSKPIRIVVGFAPGGPTDRLAREIAPKLQEVLGQTVNVENRPGADSRIAFELVARAEPDGHTLLVAGSQAATHMAVHKKLSFDTLRDFEPITQLAAAATILAVPSTSKVNSATDLLQLARSRSSPLTYASSGVASSTHFAGALLAMTSGVEMIHVPYNGAAPAQNALVGGQVDFGFVSPISSVGLLRDRTLRPIAVTSKTRLAEYPELPTLIEIGLADFEVSGWQGVLAPAKTPPAVIERLHREIAKVLANPEVRARLQAIGAEPIGSTPAAFRQYIRSEIDRWSLVARRAHIQIN
jgi:tripartite-type tricarboxylate transporter receptor subunit TctC